MSLPGKEIDENPSLGVSEVSKNDYKIVIEEKGL